MKQELINYWQIQDALLQSYRSLFLTSQSIIFSIASIIATNAHPNATVFFILLLLGMTLLYYWFQIVNARGWDVSYFQMLILKLETGEAIENPMLNFKEWQTKSKQQKISILKEFKLDKSKTRTTLGVILPALFVFLWLFLSVMIFIK